jgi:hypothetical protein
MRGATLVFLGVALLSLTALPGCSRGRQLGRVKGVVTYHGQPVTSGVIRFQSDSGPAAGGGFDASGQFTLTTRTPNDGALEGSHKVIIQPFYPGAGDMPMPPPPDPENIPKKYRELSTTPLTVTVAGGKLNEFTFELAD